VIGVLALVALIMFGRVAASVRESERLRDEVSAQNERLAEAAAIVESTDDSITATTLDGTILSWNPSSERLYGYTAEEMIGRRIHAIIEPERHAEVDATLAAIARGTAVEPHEATGVHKDGTIIPVALTVSLVRGADGIVWGISTIARDISDRRAAETERESLLNELAAQNDRLRELDRMKDDFVASVSHELRTPLTSIRGYLELVREDGGLDEEQDRMLRIVDRNADRLLGLVTDLLFVAQLDAGKLTMERAPVQLASVAAESVEAATPRADATKIDLHLEADDELVVGGDRTRLAQVLDNLISNAIKFTPSGGSVDVRVFRDGETAFIEVSDSGIGIPEDEQLHLFERFFRTTGAMRAAVQGTGLGLTIVGAIAESHGGTVTVESREGGGTTFRVSLPLSHAAHTAVHVVR
jgi:PAS domain S-box-containing protein